MSQNSAKPRRIGVRASLAAGVAVVVACGSVTAIAAASQRGKAASARPRVAFVCATPAIGSFYQPIVVGAKNAARAWGVSLSYTGLSDPNAINGETMVTDLQAAINQNPQALIACDYFPPSEDPVLKAAAAKGIPVFTTNATSPASNAFAVANFSESNMLAGKQAAKQFAAGGSKYALCIDDSPGNPSVAQRCAGFAAGGKKAGLKVKVVTLPEGSDANAATEVSAVKGALSANPTIDAVLMMGPTQGPAAVLAIQQSGKAGKVKVGTFDLSTTVLQDISKGTIEFGIWQEPYLQGYMPVEAAAEYLKYRLSPEGTVGTGPTFVTKQNVAKVKSETAAYGG